MSHCRRRPAHVFALAAGSFILTAICTVCPPRVVAATIPNSAEVESLQLPGALFDHRGLVFQFPERAAADSSQLFALGVRDAEDSGALAGIWKTGRERWLITTQMKEVSASDTREPTTAWGAAVARECGAVRVAIGGGGLKADAREAMAAPFNLIEVDRRREYSAFLGVGVGSARRSIDVSAEYSRVEARRSTERDVYPQLSRVGTRLMNSPKVSLAAAGRLACSETSALRWSGTFAIHAPEWEISSSLGSRPEVFTRKALYQAWDANAAYECSTPALRSLSLWLGYRAGRTPRTRLTSTELLQNNIESSEVIAGCALRRDLLPWLTGAAGFTVSALEKTQTRRTIAAGYDTRVTDKSSETAITEQFSWGVSCRRSWFEASAGLQSKLSFVDTFYTIDIAVAP